VLFRSLLIATLPAQAPLQINFFATILAIIEVYFPQSLLNALNHLRIGQANHQNHHGFVVATPV